MQKQSVSAFFTKFNHLINPKLKDGKVIINNSETGKAINIYNEPVNKINLDEPLKSTVFYKRQ